MLLVAGSSRVPSPATGKIEDYADFVEALLSQLTEPAGLAGFSLGGYVALAVVGRGTARLGALALLDTRAAADDEAGKAARDAAIEKVRSGGAAAIADDIIGKLLAPASLQNMNLIERLKRIILRQKPETLESDLAAMRDRPDSTDSLARISAPTIVLAGDHDHQHDNDDIHDVEPAFHHASSP